MTQEDLQARFDYLAAERDKALVLAKEASDRAVALGGAIFQAQWSMNILTEKDAMKKEKEDARAPEAKDPEAKAAKGKEVAND